MTLTDALLGKPDWRALLEKLRNKEIPTQDIGPAIVRLGKPFDPERISTAKEVVASYLRNDNPWVRHEAMWFLTSWGRLREYQPALISALQNDPDLDNRCYAASCLGILQKGMRDTIAINFLKKVIEDQTENDLVRKYAYRSILQIVRNDGEPSFSPNDRQLSDIDWDWVRSL